MSKTRKTQTKTKTKQKFEAIPDVPGVRRSQTGRLKVDTTVMSAKTGELVRRRETQPPGATLEEAILRRDLTKKTERGHLAKTETAITLGRYVLEWFEGTKQRMKPSTRKTYQYYLRHLVLSVGHVKCVEFTRRHTNAFLSDLEETTKKDGEPFMQASLDSIWRHCKVPLKDMAAEYKLTDPTLRLRAPRSAASGARERRTYTLEQLLGLVDAAWTLDGVRGLEVEVLAFGGMRSGELWALKVHHLRARGVRICASISDGVWTNTTKSGKPRDAFLPVDTLKKVRARWQLLMGTQHPGVKEGYLFSSARGTPRRPGDLRELLSDASDAAGLPFVATPQVLRRTFNSLMVDQGVNLIALRAQLGHVDAVMTATYTGTLHSAQEKAWRETFEKQGVSSAT